ncbi:hypothetical protein TNCV_1866751 [Trichonephila clavipes]|nr:hypothetical protein TNCV_1866751 [Trichonephila clavipes]
MCRELKHPPVGVVWKLGEEVSAQVPSSSLDHGSKLQASLNCVGLSKEELTSVPHLVIDFLTVNNLMELI